MKAKLLALAIGVSLIGTAFFFGEPAHQHAAEEEEDLAPARSSPIPRQKPSLFQKVTFQSASGEVVKTTSDRPVLENKAAETHWDSIAALVGCATSGKNCPENLPETDPSSKFFALRDAMLDELDWFLAHDSAGSAQDSRMMQAAQYLLTVPDEEVQGRALDLALKSATIDPKLPALIADTMADVVDTENVQKIAKVLRKNLVEANAEAVTDFACNTILHGAVLASKEMAKAVPELLTDSTRSRLEACMAKLPKTERYDAMQRALYPPSAI